MKISITNPEKMASILDLVHDRDFTISAISFDVEKSKLSIPLSILGEEKVNFKKIFVLKVWKKPVIAANLIFNDVKSFEVDDKAKIDGCSINTIDLVNSTVILTGSIPVKIIMEIANFNIDLEMTDTILGYEAAFSFGV